MSHEAEQAVLGSMEIDNECIPLMGELLQPNMFQDAVHRMVFSGILSLHDEGITVDFVQIKNLGTSVQFCEDIGNSVCHASSAEYYAKIVIDDYKVFCLKALAREIDVISQTDTKPDEMISLVQKAVTEHTAHEDAKVIDHVGDIAETITFESGKHKRIPTGFVTIDEVIVGICNTDVMIVAGRPGMGKTSLMMDIAVNMSWYNQVPASFYTLEMSPEQLVSRMASTRCGVPLYRVEKGYAHDDEIDLLKEAARQMRDCPLYIKSAGGMTPMGLKRKILSDKRKHGIEVAFCDYLQLMSPDGKLSSGYENITNISRAIKQVVLQTGVPIVMGSQLKRTEHAVRPTLTDFRGSGAIEEDADIIIGLHRESYYTPETPDDAAEAIILKGRHFGTGKAELSFTGKLTHFTDKQWIE